MINRLRPRGEFARNVVTLMTGTTMAQAIPVSISPILTRLYGPEDFGVLALFISITAIFGVVANARYELAIMLPDSDEEAFNIAVLGLLVALVLSLVLLLLAVLLNEQICVWLGNKAIGPWLYFVPITVFFLGLFNALNYYNNRLKNYKDIAQANILKSVVLASVQLIAGLFKVGAGGLVVGQVVSSVFANAKLLRNTLAQVDWRKRISWRSLKALGYRYRDFPKFSLPAGLANVLAQNLTNILISLFYSVSTLGFYSLVQRVLGMPSALVGAAISQVFFRQAMAEKRETGAAVRTFNSTLKYLVLISLPMFIVIFFVIEDVFALVFGEQWRVAGYYAKILIPFFAVRFIVSAVTTINSVFEKQKISLAWQVLWMISAVSVIGGANFFDMDFPVFLWAFSIVGIVLYLVLLCLLHMVSRGRI